VVEDNWPPRFTMTAEGAARMILLNYEAERNEAKTVLAITCLVNEAYQQGLRAAQPQRPDDGPHG